MSYYKTWPLFIALLCLEFWAKGQTISGTVLYDDTGKPATGATVYYNGSGIGTITDSVGHFELRALSKQIPVNASFIGYYTATENYDPAKPFIIRLKPKAEELKTVTIRGDDGMSLAEKRRRFFIGFVGTSDYALSCTIKNINDVDLHYNQSTKTLSATAKKPIIVTNDKLGYTIYYYLDSYTAEPQQSTTVGHSLYFDNPEVSKLPKTKRRREDAYNGSRMQFIRALWHNELKRSGFNIYNTDYHSITEDSVRMIDRRDQRFMVLHGKVLVDHRSNRSLSSYIYTIRNYVYLDKSGYNGAGLYFGGYLGSLRLGDELPLDYVSDIDKDNFPEFISEKTKATQKAAERKQAIKDSIAAAHKAMR